MLSRKKQTNNKYSTISKSAQCYTCEILKHINFFVCVLYKILEGTPGQNSNSLVTHLKKHRCQIHQKKAFKILQLAILNYINSVDEPSGK